MKAKFYMLLPVVLLGLSLAGWAVMISAATGDPSFSVEPSYYKKAAQFEEELARRAHTRELGWHATVLEFRRTDSGEIALEVTLSERAGAPLSGVELQVEALANLRAADPKNGAAVTDERGRASWLLPVGAPGLWELRLNGRRGTEVFSEVLRAELAEGRSPT